MKGNIEARSKKPEARNQKRETRCREEVFEE